MSNMKRGIMKKATLTTTKPNGHRALNIPTFQHVK